MQRDLVFISYSHKDSAYLDEILRMMSPLKRAGQVRTWTDRDIAPGQRWRDEIEAAKARTAVALLLVSADFLASDFINDHELTYFLDVVSTSI